MRITKQERIQREVIKKYGEKFELLIAIEELGEVQKELSKFIRGEGELNNIEEELADLDMVLFYIHEICKPDKSNIERWKQIKLDRLEKNLKEMK